jgi:hypothetical protein
MIFRPEAALKEPAPGTAGLRTEGLWDENGFVLWPGSVAGA